MKSAERFNLSWLSRFINSMKGRVFRIVAGSGFLIAGLMYYEHPLGIASLVWSFFPLSSGLLDICYISILLGGPLSGGKIRACQLEARQS